MFVCGGGILVAAMLVVFGMAVNSFGLKKAGVICFLIVAIVSCLPLALGCCYVLWKKMHAMFKRNH